MALAGSLCVHAQTVDPEAIRIWGHGHRGEDYIATLLIAWETGYRVAHPEASFAHELDGDDSALGGLYTEVADLAIVDREASFIELDAYQQGTGDAPFRIPVAQGSVGLRQHAPALIVSLNPENPLSHLSLRQLDGIFDADRRLGERSLKTWGDLGLTGEWATRPIQVYTYKVRSPEMQFFERAALHGSQKLACCLTLFEDRPERSAEDQIAAALRRDRYGLAVSALPAADAKAIALSATEADTPVMATEASIRSGAYPLARTIYIYADRKPKSPISARVAGFLAYIVSPEGQAIAGRTGGYLPLSPTMAAAAREALR